MAARKACSATPLLLLALLGPGLPLPIEAQTVSFAGSQSTVGSGLNHPYAVTVDGAGTVFIADSGNSRVVKVTLGGTQSTVASGLSDPLGMAVDGAGDIFIANTYNNRVLKITPAGIQSTVGSGLDYPSGVAVDAAGDVFIADNGNNSVLKVAPNGTQTIVVGSGLSRPSGLAVDGAGDVFIADEGNGRVVEITPAGIQSTVASGLSGPIGVAVDGAGDVFIADPYSNRVVEVNPAGAQTTVASGLDFPTGLAVDGAGDVFIADTNNNRVLEVQTGSANFGPVNLCPAGQTSPAPCSQTLVLSYTVTAAGTLAPPRVLTDGVPALDYTLASGSTCSGPVTAGSSCAVNVTFAPRFAGARRGAVQLTDTSGTVLGTTLLQGLGVGPQIAFGPGPQTTVASGLHFPNGLAVDGAGDVFIADTANLRVLEISPAGAQTTVGSGLDAPLGVAVDGAGDIFIADTGNSRVVEVTRAGIQSMVASGLSGAAGLAVDAAGNVFIAAAGNNRVVEVSPAGIQSTVGSGLSGPGGLAVDAAGDVFIADTGNNRVVEVTPAGAQSTVGSGLNQPYNVAVDGAGDVFIADTGNSRVVEVTPAGIQSTVGSGWNQPYGVAVDAASDVFIADSGNNRVVEVGRTQPSALSFAATPVGSTSADSPQSVTVENIGNAPLASLAPGLSLSPNFTQVPGAGTPTDCTATFSLAPGAGCNLSLAFSPTVSGPLNGAAVLSDNALNGMPATQSIPLSGTALALAQSISFPPIVSQVQGTPVTLTATATSGLAVSFSSQTPTVCTVTGSAATLLVAGTCTLHATQAGNGVYAAAAPVLQSFAVIPAATFSLTVKPPAEVAFRGVLADFVLQLQSVHGFNGNVTLSCSGGPAGSRCANLPMTVHVNGTAYAVSGILFPKNTPPGLYTLTLTGVSGALTQHATATITVK